MDTNATFPPRRSSFAFSDSADTMPGIRHRQSSDRFAAGDLILNRYKVLSELGRGSMGVVYKCFDEEAGIEIALKTLTGQLAEDERHIANIRDNFQLIYNLHHPNIASTNNLEFDNHRGCYYLLMECCYGEDLRRYLRRHCRMGEPLRLKEVLPVIQQVASALDYAHGKGVIHRDVKPGNIMISPSGEL